MQSKYFAAVAFMLWGASAFAGLINEGLSAEEAHQIKRLAIVSGLGDVIHGRLFGLTRFQSKNFDMAVSGWGLDSTVATELKDQIAAGGKIGADIAALPASLSKKSEILGEARSQGFDAVLVVIAEPSVPDPAMIGGVMLVREKKLGVDRIFPCVGIVIRVWRVSDGNQIGFTAPKPCGHDFAAPAWHDKWEEFSEQEKQSTRADLAGFVIERMNGALIALKLR